MKKKILKLSSFAIVSFTMVTVFQNCANSNLGPISPAAHNSTDGGGNLFPTPVSTITAIGPVYHIWANNTQPCNTSQSFLTQQIVGAGPLVKGCVAYTLTAPNRAGETTTCNSLSNFVSLQGAPGWSYDATSDTWSTPTMRYNDPRLGLVPGFYTHWFLTPDNVARMADNSYTLTNPSDPNTCN